MVTLYSSHHLASLWMCRCRSATARSNPRCTNTVRDWRRSCQRDTVNKSQHCGHHNSLSRNDLISIVFLMSCKISSQDFVPVSAPLHLLCLHLQSPLHHGLPWLFPVSSMGHWAQELARWLPQLTPKSMKN